MSVWSDGRSSEPAFQPPTILLLRLDGFEGPLDLLLDLARRPEGRPRAHSPTLSLVEQYLAVIESARRVRLEVAADWLVMAAWLTWLEVAAAAAARGTDAAEEGEAAAEILASRLRDLQAMRAAAEWLGAPSRSLAKKYSRAARPRI